MRSVGAHEASPAGPSPNKLQRVSKLCEIRRFQTPSLQTRALNHNHRMGQDTPRTVTLSCGVFLPRCRRTWRGVINKQRTPTIERLRVGLTNPLTNAPMTTRGRLRFRRGRSLAGGSSAKRIPPRRAPARRVCWMGGTSNEAGKW